MSSRRSVLCSGESVILSAAPCGGAAEESLNLGLGCAQDDSLLWRASRGLSAAPCGGAAEESLNLGLGCAQDDSLLWRASRALSAAKAPHLGADDEQRILGSCLPQADTYRVETGGGQWP